MVAKLPQIHPPVSVFIVSHCQLLKESFFFPLLLLSTQHCHFWSIRFPASPGSVSLIPLVNLQTGETLLCELNVNVWSALTPTEGIKDKALPTGG